MTKHEYIEDAEEREAKIAKLCEDAISDTYEIIKEAEDKGIQVGWSNPC